VAASRKFTRIPKVSNLQYAGVPTEVIPTYCALTDYANNTTGLCWPKMETLAHTLNRSVRTVQRHLHLLRDRGLIEFVERRRTKGRYSSYLYKVLHICATTGHGSRMAKGRSNIRRTKQLRTGKKSPSKNVKDGYWWLFGEDAPGNAEEEHRREAEDTRKDEARNRQRGYEQFFE
jgi:DNA-binding transcriptional ArsR family regulator